MITQIEQMERFINKQITLLTEMEKDEDLKNSEYRKGMLMGYKSCKDILEFIKALG